MSEPTPAPAPRPAPPTCDHPDGCTTPATHQTQRDATETEAAAHWDNLERTIREHGNPDYIQNRDDTVTIAQFRCDHPDHADPTYLEALAAQVQQLGGHAAPVEFTTDEHGNHTPHWPTAPE